MPTPQQQTPFVAKKLYYRIGEVCSIIGVEAHVLRYWETEFPTLAPPKNKSGQRTYRAKDIELLLMIRNLLYNEGFTIAGARKQLALRTGRGAPEPEHSGREKPGKAPAGPPAQRLNLVREELENILSYLNEKPQS